MFTTVSLTSTSILAGNNREVQVVIANGFDSQAVVRLSLTTFDLDQSTFFLSIFDGPSTSSTRLGHLTGPLSQLTQTTFASTGSFMKVLFERGFDPVTANVGFTANITSLSEFHMSTSCADAGGALVVSAASFARISYRPLVSSSNINCSQSVTLFSGSAGQSVQLVFDWLSIDEGVDVLSFHDGNSSAAPLLLTWSSNGTRLNVVSTGPYLFLQFTSSASTTLLEFGFSASLSPTTPPTTSYFLSSGLSAIAATAYSSVALTPTLPYVAGMDETVIISSGSPSRVVRLVVTSLNIRNGSDFVYIHNGPSSSSQFVGSLTGSLASLTETS